MKRGEIYLVSLDPTKGNEQAGQRPVLIISPTAFNQLTQTPIVVPITTGGNFARTEGFAVSLSGSGCDTQGVVRCDQVRALAIKQRGAKKIETLAQTILDEVLARVQTLFE